MSKIFGGSDESDTELAINTNKDYAKSYNHLRKKELLRKFKDRGYNNIDEDESDDSSESSSSEDEVLDANFDKEFFKTLASLKSKDPAIYDKKTRFFEALKKQQDDEETAAVKKQSKAKPVHLKDYERQIMLERGGIFEDDSEEEQLPARATSPTAVEEERQLRAEFKQVMNAEDSNHEEAAADFGGIFKKRQKSKEETAKEEEDFAAWLAGKRESIKEEVKEKLQPLKSYWNSSKLPQSERFLRDYILNQGYANTKFADIPTYEEIVGDEAPLSEDEQELERQAEFEHKYNYRFEEPDAEFIQRYPRTIESSLRRNDETRKLKRQETKVRKEQEKQQKMKEFEMVKEMKRKEIEEKIRKLKAVTGNDELGFKDAELEEDFDPEAHDRRMQELFNDDYYQVDEGEEKPECPSDIEELKLEDWDNYDPAQANNDDDEDYVPHCEDDDFNMDCDYDAAAAKQKMQNELIENTKARKGRRARKNQFMEMIQAEKPAFDPEDERTYAEYIDEYYKLDCEDVIGDIACRFKYVETEPNDFGLTIEEILLAKNKELNQWASLKKAIQIRPLHVEKKEQRLFRMKAKNDELKRKIFKSLYGEDSDAEEEQQPEEKQAPTVDNVTAEKETKSKKKRKRLAKAKAAAQAATAATGITTAAEEQLQEGEVATKKAKLEQANEVAEVKTENVQSAETAAKKKKKKKKKGKVATNLASVEKTEGVAAVAVVVPALKAESVQSESKDANEKKNIKLINAAPQNAEIVAQQKQNKQQLKQQLKDNAKRNMQNPFNKTTITTNKPAAKSFAKQSTKTQTTNAKNPFKSNDKFAKTTAAAKPAHKVKPNVAIKVNKNKFEGKQQKQKPKFQKKTQDVVLQNGMRIDDDRLRAYGINPNKFRKQQIYGKDQKDNKDESGNQVKKLLKDKTKQKKIINKNKKQQLKGEAKPPAVKA